MVHEKRRLHTHHQLLARQGKGENEKDEDEKDENEGGKPPKPPVIKTILSDLASALTRRPTRTRVAPSATRTVTPPNPNTIVNTPPSVPVTDTTPVVPSPPSTTLPTPTLSTPTLSTAISGPSAQISPSLNPVKPATTTLTVTSQKSTSLPIQSSTTKTAQSSGAVSTGVLAGGIVGGLAGAALLGILIFFFVRRYRRKSLEDLAFNASKFRNSALMLNDPPPPPEKQSHYQSTNAARPRPPSMIERHLNAPAIPQTSASNPYAEHAAYSTDPYAQYTASANQYSSGMYGADGQVARAPYTEMYGGNVSGAVYGQHARYGQQQDPYGAPRTQMYQQYPDEQQQQQFQPSFSPGQILPSSRSPANDAQLPNPFSHPSVSASAVVAAARSAASADSPTPSPRSNGEAPSSYVNRRAAQNGSSSPTQEHQAHYADVQRDVKTAPGTLTVVNGDDKSDRVRGSLGGMQQEQRPSSSYTLYDVDDIYGGMK